MGNIEMELLKIIASFFFGGLAGAVFTFLVSRRRQRVEFVIRVSDKYLDIFDGIANCKAYLANPPLDTKDPTKINQVRKTGDWFELVSIYYDSGYLSKGLLAQTGLLNELRKFHELITQRKNEAGSPVSDAWLWWPYFDKLIRKIK